jgi:transcriptional regulator with XRE-family HTH domain
MEFSELVRKNRKKQGLTLKDLADKTGVSVSQLSKIERGSSEPQRERVVLIAKGLGMSEEALLVAAGYASKSLEEITRKVIRLTESYQVSFQEATKRQEQFLQTLMDLDFQEWSRTWMGKHNKEDLSAEQLDLLSSEVSDFYEVRRGSMLRGK